MKAATVALLCSFVLVMGGCASGKAGSGTESDGIDCQDGTDNDGDGFVDCDDTDCLIHAWCAATQETAAVECVDGVDNDNDTLIDCDDPSCGLNDFCQNCPGCLVGPTCFDDGMVNPANACQVCDAASATDAWTNEDGKGCDDGLFCNGGDTCDNGACSVHAGDPCTSAAEICTEDLGCDCPGCVILGTCHLDGAVNPDNDCQVCDAAVNDAVWTDADGVACDDGVFCNGNDTCTSGACTAHAGDPCSGLETCDEGGGQCLCPGCVIGSVCIVDGALNPANECEVCDTATSDTAWSDNDGVSCDDGIFCNGADTCTAGTCSVHPGDPCAPFTCDETNGVCLAQDINITDGTNDLLDGSGVYDFGLAMLGGAPLVHSFVVENSGNLNLSVTSVALTSGDLGDFTLTPVATPLTVVPAGSAAFDITYAPQSLGAKSVEVTVLSDDPDEATYTFTVEGAVTSGGLTFNYTGSSEFFTVPTGVTLLNVEAWAAQGGDGYAGASAAGGLGAHVVGDISVTPGQVLRIVVGETGSDGNVFNANSLNGGGGGGGSFVIDNASNSPLLIAGGGGGGCNAAGAPGDAGHADTTGGAGSYTAAVPGEGGFTDGCCGGGSGCGGGGWNSAGTGNTWCSGGAAAGGAGGAPNNRGYGGFGGGAGTYHGGGGGGGYTGGSGGHPPSSGTGCGGGGGGGSYNTGANPSATAGVNSGNGQVVFSW